MHFEWHIKVGEDVDDEPAAPDAAIRGRRFWLWVMTTVVLALFAAVIAIAAIAALTVHLIGLV